MASIHNQTSAGCKEASPHCKRSLGNNELVVIILQAFLSKVGWTIRRPWMWLRRLPTRLRENSWWFSGGEVTPGGLPRLQWSLVGVFGNMSWAMACSQSACKSQSRHSVNAGRVFLVVLLWLDALCFRCKSSLASAALLWTFATRISKSISNYLF